METQNICLAAVFLSNAGKPFRGKVINNHVLDFIFMGCYKAYAFCAKRTKSVTQSYHCTCRLNTGPCFD